MDFLKKNISWPWWKWILGIDLFFIFTTILIRHISLPELRFFNMADEMNISVWWHGMSLFVASLLAYELFSTKNNHTRTAWLSLSIIMLGFSLDEIGSLHERISLHSSTTPYKLIVIFLFLYSLSILFLKKDTRKSANFILVGFILYAAVVAQEKIEHVLIFPQWARGIRAGVEEGSELVATFLVLWGITSQRNQRHASEPVSILIPKPFFMRFLPFILFIGFGLHIYASIVSSHLNDSRGNPASWFPSALFFLLFCQFYWESVNPTNERNKDWLLISIYFILCSMVAIQIYRIHFLPFYYFYIGQLPIILIIFLRTFNRFSRKNIIIFIAISCAIAVGFINKTAITQYIVSGLFAYLVVMIFNDKSFTISRERKGILKEESTPYSA
jgi:hypothetical protein